MAIRPPVVLIAGPTASGKSELALRFARSRDAIIINADSAQVYRDLPLLSAAPDAKALCQADHRLYGFADGAEPLSAAHWARLAAAEIDQAHEQGRLPVLVGGTGLYLRTLIDGIAPVPPIDPAIREHVRAAPTSDNRDQLGRLDPQAFARLSPKDTTRIARALEVVMSTGRPLAEWQRERSGGIGERIALAPLVLLPPREWLYQRCDRRFQLMADCGAAEEVARLLQRGLAADLPVMRAIGVREIAAWLDGSLDRSAAIAAGQQATRRYAKRQYTWFAHQPPASWPRFTGPLDEPGMARALAMLACPD